MSNSHWRTIPGFVQVASLGKTKGIDGAVRLKARDELLEQIATHEFLFIEIEGNKVPIRVADYEMSGDLYIYFDGLETKEAAAAVVGKPVYVPEDEFVPVEKKASDLQFAHLVDYTIVNAETEIGRIAEVREFPQQEIAVVITSEGEVMIPMHDDLIQSVDEGSKLVRMVLPEGLLDL